MHHCLCPHIYYSNYIINVSGLIYNFQPLEKTSDGSRITVYSLIFCHYHVCGIIQMAYIVAHWEVSNGKVD